MTVILRKQLCFDSEGCVRLICLATCSRPFRDHIQCLAGAINAAIEWLAVY